MARDGTVEGPGPSTQANHQPQRIDDTDQRGPQRGLPYLPRVHREPGPAGTHDEPGLGADTPGVPP